MSKTAKQREIDRNHAYFKKILPTLRGPTYRRHALLRHAKVIAIFDTERDAHTTGERFYEDALFSVEEVPAPAITYHGPPYHAVPMGKRD